MESVELTKRLKRALSVKGVIILQFPEAAKLLVKELAKEGITHWVKSIYIGPWSWTHLLVTVQTHENLNQPKHQLFHGTLKKMKQLACVSRKA